MSATAHAHPVPPADTPGWALQLPFPPPGNVPAQNRSIPGQGFLLGRGEMVFDEAFDDPAMSLRHAEILRQGAEAVVRDLGGGIRVNGAIVLGSHALVEGDVLRLGDTLLVYTSQGGALRDRRADIPALSRALLAHLDGAGRVLSPDLAEELLIHPWPLNVRGLSNVLSIAVIASPAGQPLELGPEVCAALQDNCIERPSAPPEVPTIELDRVHLEKLLQRFGGRVAEMARHAGVSRPKLHRLLWAAGLDPAHFRPSVKEAC